MCRVVLPQAACPDACARARLADQHTLPSCTVLLPRTRSKTSTMRRRRGAPTGGAGTLAALGSPRQSRGAGRPRGGAAKRLRHRHRVQCRPRTRCRGAVRGREIPQGFIQSSVIPMTLQCALWEFVYVNRLQSSKRWMSTWVTLLTTLGQGTPQGGQRVASCHM